MEFYQLRSEWWKVGKIITYSAVAALKRQEGPPHPKLSSEVETDDTTCTPQGYEKVCCSHPCSPRGDRARLSSRLEMAGGSKEWLRVLSRWRVREHMVRCWWGLKLLPASKEGAPETSHQFARMWGRNSKNEGRLCIQSMDGNHFSRALEGASVKNTCSHYLNVTCIRVYSNYKGTCANFVMRLCPGLVAGA